MNASAVYLRRQRALERLDQSLLAGVREAPTQLRSITAALEAHRRAERSTSGRTANREPARP